MANYPPPVDRLLNFREPQFKEEWPDYVTEFDLGSEHVPELLRLGVDPELHEAEWTDPASWGPIHARRALGQLRALEAVRPLLQGLEKYHLDDDFWSSDLHGIITRIGPPAIPHLAEHLADPASEQYARNVCTEILARIAKEYLETRAEVIGALTAQLARKQGGEKDLAVNGFTVGALLDLEAVESASVIEDAFAAGVVDESIAGDWPWVRYKLGLGPEPERRRFQPSLASFQPPRARRKSRPDPRKLKEEKQKAQKKARKQNRKRS